MSDNTSLLKAMLQDIINDRPEQAQASMHNYFIAKSREVTGTVDQTSQTQEVEQETSDDSTEE